MSTILLCVARDKHAQQRTTYASMPKCHDAAGNSVYKIYDSGMFDVLDQHHKVVKGAPTTPDMLPKIRAALVRAYQASYKGGLQGATVFVAREKLNKRGDVVYYRLQHDKILANMKHYNINNFGVFVSRPVDGKDKDGRPIVGIPQDQPVVQQPDEPIGEKVDSNSQVTTDGDYNTDGTDNEADTDNERATTPTRAAGSVCDDKTPPTRAVAVAAAAAGQDKTPVVKRHASASPDASHSPDSSEFKVDVAKVLHQATGQYYLLVQDDSYYQKLGTALSKIQTHKYSKKEARAFITIAKAVATESGSWHLPLLVKGNGWEWQFPKGSLEEMIRMLEDYSSKTSADQRRKDAHRSGDGDISLPVQHQDVVITHNPNDHKVDIQLFKQTQTAVRRSDSPTRADVEAYTNASYFIASNPVSKSSRFKLVDSDGSVTYVPANSVQEELKKLTTKLTIAESKQQRPSLPIRLTNFVRRVTGTATKPPARTDPPAPTNPLAAPKPPAAPRSTSPAARSPADGSSAARSPAARSPAAGAPAARSPADGSSAARSPAAGAPAAVPAHRSIGPPTILSSYLGYRTQKQIDELRDWLVSTQPPSTINNGSHIDLSNSYDYMQLDRILMDAVPLNGEGSDTDTDGEYDDRYQTARV
jgi:hypothetical protein